MQSFKRKLTSKDKRRILMNKATKKHEMVKKTISKTGKVQVCLVDQFIQTCEIVCLWAFVIHNPVHIDIIL